MMMFDHRNGLHPLYAMARTAVRLTFIACLAWGLAGCDYFAEKHVRLEPQRAADFTGLKITLPVPPGWTQVPDPNVPDAFAAYATRIIWRTHQPPRLKLVTGTAMT